MGGRASWTGSVMLCLYKCLTERVCLGERGVGAPKLGEVWESEWGMLERASTDVSMSARMRHGHAHEQVALCVGSLLR